MAACGGEPAGTVSPLPPPADDLNQRIIRLLQDDGRAALHVHGHSDVAWVEAMTRIGTFRNRFLLERHVP